MAPNILALRNPRTETQQQFIDRAEALSDELRKKAADEVKSSPDAAE